jgi:hypothetical protein
MEFLLCHATSACQVVFILAAFNLFRGSQFSWVPILLMALFLCYATVAQLDTFLQAAANFFSDPQSLQISSFGSLHRPAAGFLPFCRLFRPLTGFTMASPLGTT